MSDDQTLKEFLDKVAMIESSQGRNTKHDLITKGAGTGTRAIGTYGLTPRTIKDIAPINPEVKYLSKLPEDEIYNIVSKDPEIERKLAETLANKVLTETKGNQLRAGYMWNMGHNLEDEELDERNFLDSKPAKRFQQEEARRFNKELKQEQKKADKNKFNRIAKYLNEG